jgi:uncharacterized damage-inducible protein DinB
MIGKTFVQIAATTLTAHAGRIDACLAKLSPEQIWRRSSEHENAIGNLVLHLCGNVHQYTRHALLGESDIRQRDDEFNAESGANLRDRLSHTVADAAAIISAITEQRLEDKITVQGREMTVLEAVFRTTEHFSLHAGQIYFATKQLTSESLGFFTHNRRPTS